MRGEVPHLVGEGTRDGRPVKLAHPLHAGTFTAAVAVWEFYGALVPADTVWFVDAPVPDPPVSNDCYDSGSVEPQEGTP